MMATADLITAYLSNEMSPERERQFLLSVAASDSLRLELKSHLMLDRMMGQRVQSARVPDAVRMAIFAQAGIATATAPSSADASLAQGAAASRAAANGAGFFTRRPGRMTLVAAALAFFGAGYATGIVNDDESRVNAASNPAVTTPVTNAPVSPSVDAQNAKDAGDV